MEQQEFTAVTTDAEQTSSEQTRVERLVSQPFFSRDGVDVHNRDCRELLAEIDDSSIDLIVTDPPYFKVKDAEWDWQWDKPEHFLAWMGTLCDEWQRVLKPNGSLYVFASPQMAWGVEGEVRNRFNVCNCISWRKDGRSRQQCKEEQRQWWPDSERIIFAEQRAANEAVTFADYELNGRVFKPIKDWFRSRTNGMTSKDLNRLLGYSVTGSGPAGWIIDSKPQFRMPTAEVYAKMRAAFPVFDREYEDLRREYGDLRRE